MCRFLKEIRKKNEKKTGLRLEEQHGVQRQKYQK